MHNSNKKRNLKENAKSTSKIKLLKSKKKKQSQHETHDDHHEQQQRRHHRLYRTRNNHTLDEQQHVQEAKNNNIICIEWNNKNKMREKEGCVYECITKSNTIETQLHKIKHDMEVENNGLQLKFGSSKQNYVALQNKNNQSWKSVEQKNSAQLSNAMHCMSKLVQ